jgi:hypothetical protein
MRATVEPLPSPLMGEGSGGGEASAPPIPTFPRQRGRGICLPLSALTGGQRRLVVGGHNTMTHTLMTWRR